MAKDKANGEERIGFFGNDKVGGLGLDFTHHLLAAVAGFGWQQQKEEQQQ